MNPRRRLPVLLGSAAVAVAVLTACGATAASHSAAPSPGSTIGENTAGGSGSAVQDNSLASLSPSQGKAQMGLAPAAAPVRSPAQSTDPAVQQQAVIRTGQLQVQTKDPATTRADVLSAVTALRGTVAQEQSVSDDHGRLVRVDLTLRVPSASFDRALDELGRLGTVLHRQQSSEDVTTQVIDNAARIRAQAASVNSIQRLLAQAKTLGEVISIERELTQRQADLDSLTQQQKYLVDQTSLSTLQLTLTKPAPKPAPPAKARTGFVGGLHNGWEALGDSAVAVGSGVGAALPFAALLALVGYPVWIVVRRRRPAAVAPVPTEA